MPAETRFDIRKTGEIQRQERAGPAEEKVATSDGEMSSSISGRQCMVGATHL